MRRRGGGRGMDEEARAPMIKECRDISVGTGTGGTSGTNNV